MLFVMASPRDGSELSATEMGETMDSRDAETLDAVTASADPAPGAAEGDDDTLPKGTMLSESYRVERVLGRGGMGVVYVVEHVDLERRFAAKVLARTVGSTHLERLKKEARVASGIRHPNIVDVVHLGRRDDGSFFIVMELLEGEDLGARNDRQHHAHPEAPWLPDEEVRTYAKQIFDAITAAHAAGVVHRDLKPDNVFLTTGPDGHTVIKLLDFGIAKAAESRRDHRLTRTGQIMGTPLYMAPEQTRSTAEVDARADIYSMGVILYEMVTGAPPFEAETTFDLIVKHATEPPVPPRERRPDLPAAVETVILRCLEKSSEARYESAEALAHAWETAWSREDVAERSDDSPLRSVARERSSKSPKQARGPTAEVAPENGGSPSRVAIGLAGLVILAVAVVVGSALLVDEPEATTSAPSPAPMEIAAPPEVATEPVTRSRSVISEPPGARVLRDGREIGTTPFDLELEAGEVVSLELSAEGHASTTASVSGDEDGEVVVTLAALEAAETPRVASRPGMRRGAGSTVTMEEEPTPTETGGMSMGGLLLGVDVFDSQRER
jgi:serine/threonine-protein kinase